MSDEVSWKLPDSWQQAPIADFGNVVSGDTPSTKDPSYWNGEMNWITPADLSGYSNKFIMRGAKSLTIKGLENSSAKLMPAGSVHFSSRAQWFESSFWVAELGFGRDDRSDLLDGVSRDDRGLAEGSWFICWWGRQVA